MTTRHVFSILVSLVVFFSPSPTQGLQADTIQAWRVESDPVVTIGVLEGADEYVLTNPVDMVGLEDGTIVIALYQRRYFELRFYDSEGTFLRTVGRYGEGPFEVSQIPGMVDRIPGDSILVVSLDNRFSLFGPQGETVRSGRLSHGLAHPYAALIDGSHLGLIDPRQMGAGGDNRPVPQEMTFSVFDMQSGEVDGLGIEVEPGYWHGNDGAIFELPFSAPPHWAGGAGVFWYGSSEDGSIQRYSVREESETEIELLRPRLAVTKNIQDLYLEGQLAGASGERRRVMKRYHRGIAFPDSVPAFQDLTTDQAGNLWVLRYELPWCEEDYVWDIFSPGGEWLTSATAPFGILDDCLRRGQFGKCALDTYAIGEDYLLTIDRDELGVPRVKKYRLLKGS